MGLTVLGVLDECCRSGAGHVCGSIAGQGPSLIIRSVVNVRGWAGRGDSPGPVGSDPHVAVLIVAEASRVVAVHDRIDAVGAVVAEAGYIRR